MPFNFNNITGKYAFNQPLASKNRFGVGGVSDVFYQPDNIADLQQFLRQNQGLPLFILGAGSNVLIADSGFRGCVIKLGGFFNKVQVDDDVITCGAGVSMMQLAKVAQQGFLSGFSFLCSIPGTLGGGIAMNAGAYGGELRDILHSITAITPTGELVEVNRADIEKSLSYRQNALPKGYIYISATLKGEKVADNAVLQQQMDMFIEKRKQSQPVAAKTAGSTFKNTASAPAWQLIQKSGLQSFSIGGAKISEKHANFIINTGNASAKDINDLICHVQQTVFTQFNQHLELEIEKVGEGI